MKKDIQILLAACIIAVAILAGFVIHAKMSVSTDSSFVDPDSIFSGREIDSNEYTVGSGKNKVVLLEYSDLECPFCKKLHVETMPEIYKNFGAKIDIAFRHFPLPFHKKALTEADGALCARDIGGQSAYKNFIEKVYEKTSGNDTLDLSLLPSFATEIGLDENRYRDCIGNASTSEKHISIIESDLQEGSELGVSGTPTLFVLIRQKDDSYRILTTIVGARDYKYISKVLEQAVKY